jgi:hypothetical protein
MRRRFTPKQHITQMQHLTALRTMLIQTSRWPPDEESLVRSYQLSADVIRAEISCEDMRRRARHG